MSRDGLEEERARYAAAQEATDRAWSRVCAARAAVHHDQRGRQVMTKEQAFEVLAETHSIVDQQTAQDVCAAFGVATPRLRTIRDSRDDFKGVTLASGPGTSMVGIGVMELSSHIAHALGGEPHGFLGRGFQARENVRVIRERLGLAAAAE